MIIDNLKHNHKFLHDHEFVTIDSQIYMRGDMFRSVISAIGNSQWQVLYIDEEP